MNRLQTEWSRLFGADPTADGWPAPMFDKQGGTRTLVIEWGHPGDWATLSALWQAAQAELDWPAPLIAVNGRDAFQLWFSLAVPVPVETARQLAAALAGRWLPRTPADTVAGKLRVWPQHSDGAWQHATPVPALQAGSQPRWSAFVASDLAAVFDDEPALDLDPGEDAQAELLARHHSVGAQPWAHACQWLLAAGQTPASTTTGVGETVAPSDTPDLGGPFDDPAAFLKAVMNHPGAPLVQRIEAARVLLQFAALEVRA